MDQLWCGALFLLFVTVVTPETRVTTKGYYENVYFPMNGTVIRFKVKAPFDATVIFVGKLPFNEELDPYMEAGVGGNENTHSWIRRKRFDTGEIRVRTDNFLSTTEFRGFWIKLIPPASILMGKEHEKVPFLAWTDPNPFKITHFGVGICCGGTAEYIITESDGVGDLDVSPCAPDDVKTTADPWSKEPLHIVKGACYNMLTELQTCNKAVTGDNLVANKNKRYVPYEQAGSWDEAKAACEKQGQRFASVRSKEEQVELEKAIQEFKNPISGVWIAANDRAEKNQFVWNDGTNDVMDYNNWDSNAPPAHEEPGKSCVFVSYVALVVKGTAVWFVQRCSETYTIMCEAYD